MIDARELRIGNWIEALGYCQIKNGNDIDIIIRGGGGGSNGIPLTPEMLDKCGFEMDCNIEGYNLHVNIIGDDDYWDFDIYFSYNRNTQKVSELVTLMQKKDGNDEFSIPYEIKYIHQLQNLYFSLTGTELTIETLNSK